MSKSRLFNTKRRHLPLNNVNYKTIETHQNMLKTTITVETNHLNGNKNIYNKNARKNSAGLQSFSHTSLFRSLARKQRYEQKHAPFNDLSCLVQQSSVSKFCYAFQFLLQNHYYKFDFKKIPIFFKSLFVFKFNQTTRTRRAEK